MLEENGKRERVRERGERRRILQEMEFFSSLVPMFLFYGIVNSTECFIQQKPQTLFFLVHLQFLLLL